MIRTPALRAGAVFSVRENLQFVSIFLPILTSRPGTYIFCRPGVLKFFAYSDAAKFLHMAEANYDRYWCGLKQTAIL